MNIAVSNPEFYFAFFYVLSFVVAFLLIVIFSARLKIPLRSVLLMLTTVSLCTIVGSRLTTIPFSEWGNIIVTGRFEGYQGRFAVGGLLFGLAGLVLCQNTLFLNKSIINLYAWITPVGFGIQKIGCFFNGCCYGKQSDLPWSIQYPTGTNAHYHQWINGLIDENAPFSLSVHPVQLYEVIILFIIAFIVWRSLKFWKKTWSALIFSLCLFFIFRFFTEFLRDPATSAFNVQAIPGVSLLQWFLISTGIVCSILLILYEKSSKSIFQNLPETEPSPEKLILYVISLSVVIYVFRGLFTYFELLSLNIKFIPAVLLSAFCVFRSLKTVRFRFTTTPLFVLPLFLIAQTLTPDSTKSMSVRDFYKGVKSYKRVDLDVSLGDFYNTVRYNPHEGECGTAYSHEDYRHLYRIAGAGFSFIKNEGESTSTKGINLYGGINQESNLTKQWEKTDFLFGVNPYYKYDLKWVGFGVGAHLGNIRWVAVSPISKIYFDRGTRFFPVLPEVLIRAGRRDILDLQYKYGFNLPASIPVLMHEFSIGSGFGFKTDYNLRFGAALSQYYATTFISAETLLGKNLGLTFRYNFGGDDFYFSNNYIDVIERKGRILVGANYRFGFKK